MKVSKNSWHFKVYSYWYNSKYGEGATDFKSYSNLCPYMRAVLFWSWMRVLFMTKVGYIVYPLLMLELPRWAGMVSYNLKSLLVVLDIAIMLTAVLGGFIFGLNFIIKKWASTESYNSFRSSTHAVAEKGSSFFQLVGEYLRSAHDRICPEVDFLK